MSRILRSLSVVRRAVWTAPLQFPLSGGPRHTSPYVSCRLCSTSIKSSAKSGVPYDSRHISDTSTASSGSLPSEADVVVIGGGVAGCSALYHLTKLGMKNVVLLESAKLTAGTTWHSAGLVWRLRPSDLTIQLLMHTRNLLRNEDGLRADCGEVDPGWIQNGSVYVASTRDRLEETLRLKTLGDYYGVESSVLSPREIKALYPQMNVDDLHGAIHIPGEGIVEPSGIALAYSRAAVKHGAQIFENSVVTAIETKEGFQSSRQVSAVHTSRGVIRTNCVLNAAGGWSPSIGALAGVRVPLVVMKHAYVVTEPVEGIRNRPNVRDHEQSLYVKLQGDSLVFGGYEMNPIFADKLSPDFNFGLYDLDWDVFSSHIKGAVHRIPCLEKTGIKSTVSGPESFTPDHYPLMGESAEVRGFYLSCGYNSAGIMLSGGCGKQIAEWIVHGRPSLDMLAYDIRRFPLSLSGNTEWCRERSHESYSTNFSIAYPHDEPLAGRNMHKDPLHEELLQAGCIYQVRHGWERPGWFMTSTEKARGLPEVLPYDYYGSYDGHTAHQNYVYKAVLDEDNTFGKPKSFETVVGECKACRSSGALFNMSSFGKFLLTGKDAQRAADWLFTNDVGQEGKVVFTCMLNKFGGTESDVTVAKVPRVLRNSLESFKQAASGDAEPLYIACGGAVATYVQYHIQHILEDKQFDAKLIDISSKFGLLSLQGPISKQVLQSCTETDLSTTEAMQYGKQFPLLINGEQVWAMRMSYVGEFGYEFHVPMTSLVKVYHSLMSAGQELGLRNAGYRAIDFLSAEKGYHHWHSDLRTTDTPLEAGLGFLCSKNKDYLGSDVIKQQRENGVTRRRICLLSDKESGVPLFGNEAILRDGEIVSYVRRAGYSCISGQWLAFGYIETDPAVKLTDGVLAGHRFEIEQIGVRGPASASIKSPFSKLK